MQSEQAINANVCIQPFRVPAWQALGPNQPIKASIGHVDVGQQVWKRYESQKSTVAGFSSIVPKRRTSIEA